MSFIFVKKTWAVEECYTMELNSKYVKDERINIKITGLEYSVHVGHIFNERLMNKKRVRQWITLTSTKQKWRNHWKIFLIEKK